MSNKDEREQSEDMKMRADMFGQLIQQGVLPGLVPLRIDDSYIVGCLLKHGIGYPSIFSLMWGERQAVDKRFPKKLRESVSNVLDAVKKKEDCYDLCEKKLYDIIIDLSYVLYEEQVNKTVKSVVK